jgi:hypothetical protein
MFPPKNNMGMPEEERLSLLNISTDPMRHVGQVIPHAWQSQRSSRRLVLDCRFPLFFLRITGFIKPQ